MKTKYLILFLFLSIFFISCGDYNLDDKIDLTTYIEGKVVLKPETLSLNFTSSYNNINLSPFTIAGAKVSFNYAGKQYDSYTNSNGDFLLELPQELNHKNNYILSVEKGSLKLFSFIETDEFGDAKDIIINENSTIMYYVINRYLEKYEKFGLSKKNIITSVFNNNNNIFYNLTDFAISEKIKTNELYDNKHFLFLLEETKSNINNLIATIPYNNQNKFYYKDEIKLFFGTEMDTSIPWVEFISFNYDSISDNALSVYWNEDATILTIKPHQNSSFIPDSNITVYVNEQIKTAGGQFITPAHFSFYTTSEKSSLLTEYIDLNNIDNYTYSYNPLTFPIQTDTSIHTNLNIDTFINNKKVFNIGSDINNYISYSNDEEGFFIHSIAEEGNIRVFSPPVKLSNSIAYVGDEFYSNNSEGTFSAKIITIEPRLRIEFKYMYSDNNIYETKYFELEKNIGIKSIREIGNYDLDLVRYRKNIHLISPINNSLVPLKNNKLKIEWTPVSNEGIYKVELSSNSSFTHIIASDTTDATNINLEIANDTGPVYMRIIFQFNNEIIYSDIYNFYLNNYIDLSSNIVENAVAGIEYIDIFNDRFFSDEKNIYFHLIKNPESMNISPIDGKVEWIPDTGLKGLYDISLVLNDTSTNNIYIYNYKIYIIPRIVINTFINDDGETITFYSNNTFKKIVDSDTQIGLYSIIVDTITLNYISPDTFNEIGSNFYVGTDTISFNIQGITNIFRLIDIDTGQPVDPIQPLAPVITSVPKTTAIINEPYAYWVKVKPAIWGKITYELINPPAGMTVNSQGIIYWIPGQNFANQTIQIAIRVFESGAGYTTQVYSITISTP